MVEALLQRASDGVLQEDRREALADLRDLLHHNPQVSELNASEFCHTCMYDVHPRPWALQAQLAVGSQGLPVLSALIREKREDLDILRAALECLQITIGHPDNNTKGPGKVPATTLLQMLHFLVHICQINPSKH